MKFTYLLLNLFTLSYPLFRSFENKIKFFSSWKYLFPAMVISALFFISWDEVFTRRNVWSFNPEFVMGIYLRHLPIEEILFFIAVPFSCFFIYEVFGYYFPGPSNPVLFRVMSVTASVLLAIAGIIFAGKLYTAVASFSASGFLLLHSLFLDSNKAFRLWSSFAGCIIPFMIVNGVLTAMPVVVYNDAENLSIRIGTIPVEDIAYCLAMLSLNFFLIEIFRKSRTGKRIVYSSEPATR